MNLTESPILVTGASGFVGARLIERLTSEHGATIHALVHRTGTEGAARLEQLEGVKLFVGDLRDSSTLTAAAEGAGAFVHCAYGNAGSESEQKEVSVTGTRNLLEIAAQCGVERFIHFSSASVQDPYRSNKPLICEDDPVNPPDDFTYARLKGEVERLVTETCNQKSIPCVILRPTCIWGPYSSIWTVSPAKQIKRQIPFLPAGKPGKANAIYIDNLIDAVLAALTNDAALGEVFLVNDDAPETWLELYEGYAQFLGVPLKFIEQPNADQPDEAPRATGGGIKGLIRTAKTIAVRLPILKPLWKHVPSKMKGAIMSQDTPPSSAFDLYESQSRYSNEKLKTVLGWEQRVDFDTAMKRTCEWIDTAVGS